MWPKLRGPISDIEVIATGAGIRELRRLQRIYGLTRWRKLKGKAFVELEDGTVGYAEVHWFEGHGHGRKELKIKRFLSR